MELKQFKSSPSMPHWVEISAGQYYHGERAMDNAKAGLEFEVGRMQQDAIDSEFECHITYSPARLRALVLFTYKGRLRESYKLVIE